MTNIDFWYKIIAYYVISFINNLKGGFGMKTNSYQKPEVLEEVKNAEPVETGCCLRSCGGTPHHLGTSKSREIVDKLDEISEDS